MKVRPSVKPMCEKCKIIKRKGKVMVICENLKQSSARADSQRGARAPHQTQATSWVRYCTRSV